MQLIASLNEIKEYILQACGVKSSRFLNSYLYTTKWQTCKDVMKKS